MGLSIEISETQTNLQINDLARAMVRHAMQDAGPGINVLEGHSLFALTK